MLKEIGVESRITAKTDASVAVGIASRRGMGQGQAHRDGAAMGPRKSCAEEKKSCENKGRRKSSGPPNKVLEATRDRLAPEADGAINGAREAPHDAKTFARLIMRWRGSASVSRPEPTNVRKPRDIIGRRSAL